MNHARVAIQLISTGGVYGAEKVLVEIAAYVRARGWESLVVALEGRGAEELVRLSISQGVAARAFVAGGRMAMLPMMKRLRGLLQQYPRAIVHSHNYKPDILLSLLGVPRRLACVATCHSSYRESRKLRFLAAVDKRALIRFDRVVAVSAEIYKELVASGVSQSRVSLIHNGVEMPQTPSHASTPVREEFGVPPGTKLIVQIGRLVQSKRNDLLLEAVSRLEDSLRPHILLVGEGAQSSALAELAHRLGIQQQVHFCGYRDDIGQILAAADLLVLSSDYEGLPVVIIEAMAMQCPIVTTRVGAISDVLTDGEDAWIVPVNDLAGLISAITAALRNSALAQGRARSAHARFVAHHSRDVMGACYLEVYESIWAARGWTDHSQPTHGAEQ